MSSIPTKKKKKDARKEEKVLLCGFDDGIGRHDHEDAIGENGDDDEEGEEGMDEDEDGHPPDGVEGRQEPDGVGGTEPVNVLSPADYHERLYNMIYIKSMRDDKMACKKERKKGEKK